MRSGLVASTSASRACQKLRIRSFWSIPCSGSLPRGDQFVGIVAVYVSGISYRLLVFAQYEAADHPILERRDGILPNSP